MVTKIRRQKALFIFCNITLLIKGPRWQTSKYFIYYFQILNLIQWDRRRLVLEWKMVAGLNGNDFKHCLTA